MSIVERLAVYLREQRDEEQAGPMAAYMKNRFPFLGLKTPVRTALTRRFWQVNGLPSPDAFRGVVSELWALPEREFQYAAMDLLERRRKELDADDIGLLEELIVAKSWWDTVDLLAGHAVGGVLARHPERIRGDAERWMDSGHLWLQRTALLFQLRYKERTDARLLFELIERCKNSKEFFIRKAIGWALREYAKTDPDSVLRYVSKAGLSPLSEREALKSIARKG